MSYETPLECGRELDNDIKSGLILETELLPAGRAKLKLWREHKPTLTELLLEDDDIEEQHAFKQVEIPSIRP